MKRSFNAFRSWARFAGMCWLAALLAGCATRAPVVPAAAGLHQPQPAEPDTEDVHRAALAGWEVVPFPGKRLTAYQRDMKDGRRSWLAESEQSASMYRKRVFLPADRLGEVSFSWWVDALLPGADLGASGQGDAPARMVFAFDGDHSRLSMRNRMMFELAGTLTGETPPFATLMYVWANDAAPESVILNPRTDRIRKIVLESGPRHLQQWRQYRRDLAADYRRAFGEEPGPLIGLAMMTDTDNTNSTASTWYGDIQIDGRPVPLPAAMTPRTSTRPAP